MKRIENPKNTERGRNAIPPRREFISPTHLFFYFPFLTQLQTAFIIGTSYAIAKLAPKRVGVTLLLAICIDMLARVTDPRQRGKAGAFLLICTVGNTDAYKQIGQ